MRHRNHKVRCATARKPLPRPLFTPKALPTPAATRPPAPPTHLPTRPCADNPDEPLPEAHTKAPRKVIFQELGGAKGLRRAVDIFYHKACGCGRGLGSWGGGGGG